METVRQAEAALTDRRPYLATRILNPLLAPPGDRDSSLVMLAARAAASWDGWPTVARLLDGQAWLDRFAGGEGRALLARARVERSENALADARAALLSSSPGTKAFRLVVLARAFDRAALLDSASQAYQAAAELLPTVSDWLLLRAAGVEPDSNRRRSLYQQVSLPAAVPRIRWTEALARERTGDLAGAIAAYRELGATISALRLRLRTDPPPEDLAAIRRDLGLLLGPRSSADDSRAAIALLDDNFAPLTMAEELAVSERAAAVDRLARSAAGFPRVAGNRKLAEADRLLWGGALARLGRHREAMEVFATIRGPALRAQAEYARARSLMEVGRREEAQKALRHVATFYRADSATAANAGFLVAELLVDAGNDAGAREAFLQVSKRYPRTGFGSRAAFQAALIAYLGGARTVAAKEFTELAARPGDRSETAAALYWAGRAYQTAGDSSTASKQWRALLDRFPSSYYALPAAGRLGVAPDLLAGREPLPAPGDTILAMLDRGILLDQLGMRVEARFEFDRLSRAAEGSAVILPEIAAAFAERGLIARAYRLALRSEDPRLERLRFPLPRPATLYDEAHRAGVDPLLAAAIMRQESGFDPQARSKANALGLMQVVASVGAAQARADGLREWDVSLLTQPEINLRFGMSHLAQALQRYSRVEHSLAAYNAGSRPTDQWLALPGAREDPEVFMERIQYVETRDYVRRVLRNLAVYRAGYPSAP